MFASGAYTQTEIVGRLNALGFTMPRSGKPMQPSRLTTILRNPVYAGRIHLEAGGSEWVEAEFPPIVDGDLFNRVQRMLDGSPDTTEMRHLVVHPDFSLKHTVRCPVCGRTVTGGQSKGHGGTYAYYRCFNHRCRSLNVRKEKLEGSFKSLLARARLQPELLDTFRNVARQVWEEQRGDSDAEHASLQRRKQHLLAKKERLLDLYCEGTLLEDDYSKKAAEFDLDLKTVEGRLADMGILEEEYERYLNHSIDLLEKADILWQDSDIHSKLKLQEVLFPEGIAYDPNEGFLNPPMSKAFNLLGVLNASESHLVAGTGFVSDERTNSTVTSQWIYLGVCHGIKRLKRVGFSLYSLNQLSDPKSVNVETTSTGMQTRTPVL